MEKLKVAKAAVQKLVVSPVNDDNFHTEEFEEPDEEE
jgi:exodeoxyribonuclease VII small subunit